MSDLESYQLLGDVYLSATPAGAYYCVSGESDTPSRNLLRVLMQKTLAPVLNIDNVQSLTGIDDDKQALALLYRMQTLGWLEGQDYQQSVPEGSLEEALPDLLVGLSDSEKVLLADEQGFYLCSQGFPHETAEELSALSADFSSLYQRHQGLLKNNLNLETGAWAMVDAAGNGQIGFWPLWIGKHRFVLVIKGVPLLNQPALMKLIWVLSFRYGK